MTKIAEQLLQQVMELDVEDRFEFVGKLWEADGTAFVSSDPQYAAEWDAEIQRRFESYESGEEPGIPWEEVRAELFARRSEKK